MIFLRAIETKDASIKRDDSFPFNIPIVSNFKNIKFDSPVCIFVGENGSGKSTIIEALAIGMNAISVGSDQLDSDPSLDNVRKLASHFRFIRNRRPKRGFFFRAEDFFGFIKRVKSEVQDLRDLESEYEEKFSGYARMLAAGVAKGQHRALRNRYGEDADGYSHGESFLQLFESRLVPEGLYLLDEPEAPLSPQRQLALLSLIKKMVEKSCQFIIATHSPILMAYPDAQILSFESDSISPIAYDDVEHVSLTRSFLNNPENYLRRL